VKATTAHAKLFSETLGTNYQPNAGERYTNEVYFGEIGYIILHLLNRFSLKTRKEK